tara:strand:+ start:1623 stop:2528 length:906 start_codon:yes stop_codon:yes gene_type:complete
MKIVAPLEGFLGLNDNEFASTLGKPRVTVVPFGLEKTVTYGGGASRGPEAIINASKKVEFFDEDFWGETFRYYNLKTLAPFTIKEDIKLALEQIENIVEDILDDDSFPLILGGEHSLTAGAIRPFINRYEEIFILHFDAHTDLRDSYDSERFSHASVMRRCLEEPGVRIISVGVRNISAQEIEFFESNRDRINIHWAKDRDNWNIKNIIAPLKNKDVYISFDLDGFDSSLMQATGTPEPGGIFWNDAINIIKAASAEANNIIGADIVELAPVIGLHACDFLAAKLAYKILGFRFSDSHLRI